VSTKQVFPGGDSTAAQTLLLLRAQPSLFTVSQTQTVSSLASRLAPWICVVVLAWVFMLTVRLSYTYYLTMPTLDQCLLLAIWVATAGITLVSLLGGLTFALASATALTGAFFLGWHDLHHASLIVAGVFVSTGTIHFLRYSAQSRPSDAIIELLAGITGVALILAQLSSLVSPSWRNSLAVAMSMPFDWLGLEFQALHLGQVLLTGLGVFILLRAGVPAARGSVRLWLLAPTAVVVIAFAAYQTITRTPPPLLSTAIFLPFANIQLLGAVTLGLGTFFLGFALLANSPLNRVRVISGVLGLGLLAACFLSLSRAALLGLGVWLIVIIGYRWGVRMALLGIMGLVIMLLGLRLVAPPVLERALPYEAYDRLVPILHVEDWHRLKTIEVRVHLYDIALQMVRKEPLSGMGLGEFARKKHQFDSSGKPPAYWDDNYRALDTHSSWLRLASEAGAPVAMLFLGTIIAGMGRGLFTSRTDPITRAAAVTIPGLLVAAMFDSYVFFSAPSMILWAIVGLAVPTPSPHGDLSRPGKQASLVLPAAGGAVLILGAAAVGLVHAASGNRESDITPYGVYRWNALSEEGYVCMLESEVPIGEAKTWRIAAPDLIPTTESIHVWVRMGANDREVEFDLVGGESVTLDTREGNTTHPGTISLRADRTFSRLSLEQGRDTKVFSVTLEPISAEGRQP